MVTHSVRRPRILLLAHRIPYPPDKGDRIRVFHILRWLSHRSSIHLACLADEPYDARTVEQLKTLCERVEVISLGRWSRCFQSTLSLSQGRTASEGAFWSKALVDILSRWSKQIRFDLALASSSALVPYLRIAELVNVPAVVDLVDVDSQKWFDYASASGGPRRWLYHLEGTRLRRLERDITRWAKAVTLVSDAEANLFRQFCDSSHVFTVPNGVDLEKFQLDVGTGEPENGCIFVGALDHRPNVDGACWFCQEIWPEIHRRRPAARMVLVGRQTCSGDLAPRSDPGSRRGRTSPGHSTTPGPSGRGRRAIASGPRSPEQGPGSDGDGQSNCRLASIAGWATFPGRLLLCWPHRHRRSGPVTSYGCSTTKTSDAV